MFSDDTWFCILVFAMKFQNGPKYTHTSNQELPKLLWAGDTGFGDRFGDPEKKRTE